jgi:FKBP-type peptidyl-prolyl cis-trans isomerase
VTLWAALLIALAGGRPGPQDCVKVRYRAWKSDGTVVAERSGAPEVQCLGRTTPAVARALRAMSVGERRRVRVKTGDDLDLTYDLELVDIIRAPVAPPRAPPRSAPRTASGLAREIVRHGTGGAHPSLASQVTIHLSGWTREGTLVESTVMAAHPAIFPVRDLLPGLREGVQLLVAGDRARFWIPSALAYGDRPRRGQPAGPLVYEVELLAIQ